MVHLLENRSKARTALLAFDRLSNRWHRSNRAPKQHAYYDDYNFL